MEIVDWDFLGSPYETLRAQHWWNIFRLLEHLASPARGHGQINSTALTILDRPEMNASLHVKTPEDHEDPERSEKGFRRICKASNDCSILGILRDPWWKSRVSDYQKMLQS